MLGKLRKALGSEPAPFGRTLEIGAGTGYFTLNLLRAGLIEEAVASDISQGMLDCSRGHADRLGLEVETVRAEAERLPFPDGSFDLVLRARRAPSPARSRAPPSPSCTASCAPGA